MKRLHPLNDNLVTISALLYLTAIAAIISTVVCFVIYLFRGINCHWVPFGIFIVSLIAAPLVNRLRLKLNKRYRDAHK